MPRYLPIISTLSSTLGSTKLSKKSYFSSVHELKNPLAQASVLCVMFLPVSKNEIYEPRVKNSLSARMLSSYVQRLARGEFFFMAVPLSEKSTLVRR